MKLNIFYTFIYTLEYLLYLFSYCSMYNRGDHHEYNSIRLPQELHVYSIYPNNKVDIYLGKFGHAITFQSLTLARLKNTRG